MPIFIDFILLTSPFCFEQSICVDLLQSRYFFSGWFASTGVWNYSFVSISDTSAQFEEHVWIITTPRDLMISWTRTTAREEAANQIRQGSDPVSLELLYCLRERTTVTRGDKVVMGNKKRDCDKKRPALMWVCEYCLLKRMISKSHIWDRVTCFQSA